MTVSFQRPANSWSSNKTASGALSRTGVRIQTKLTVNRPDDQYEQEADRVADQVMRMPERSLQRQCSCGKSATEGECPECKKKKAESIGSLRRVASSPAGGFSAPPIVDQVLSSPGSPLPHATRSFMESRFGQDFSHVRVHTDHQAAESALAVQARAYTAGNRIVFGRGEHPSRDYHLLAHELTHVVQQGGVDSVAQPKLLQRYGYEDAKRDFYRGAVSGLETARVSTVSAMRGLAGLLPPDVKAIASHVVDVVDTVIDVSVQLDLFIIGMAVGFGEGIVGMIKGLIGLGYSILKTLWHLISGFFTGFDPLKNDASQFLAVLVELPGTLKQLVTSWMSEFEHASMERQSIMIGELTGQIEAVVATFALSAGRAGTVAKVASESAEVGQTAATAVRGAEVIDLATARASKLTQAAESTGASRGVTQASASAIDGSAARHLHPIAEPVAGPQPIQLPKSIPANDVAPLPNAPPSRPPIALPIAATVTAVIASTSRNATNKTKASPYTLPRVGPEPEASEESKRRGCESATGPQLGGNSCHDAFAASISGVPREFILHTPDGDLVSFDALGPDGVLYEVKTGYRWLVFNENAPNRQERIYKFIEQSLIQQRVADRCGYPLVWVFNDEDVEHFFSGVVRPETSFRPFPCERDSD